MTTFGALAARGSLLVNDGYRTKASELGEPGFPVLRVAEIGDGSINPSYGDHVREEYRDKINYKLSKPGDVLLTTKGTVGRRTIMPRLESVFAYSPQLCFFRVLDDSIDARWLYYWLGGADFWEQATGVSQQTDMAPYISLRDLRAIDVAIPPIEEQRSIAATLGAMDDKIESNRHIAQVALDLAEALYLQACAKGAETIPLKDAGRWLSGGTPSTTQPEYWGGDLPWISSASLKSFFVWRSDRCLTEAGVDAATNVVPAGTVLLVVRGMSLKTEFRFGVAQSEVAFGQDCKAILPAVPTSALAMALRTSRDDILNLVDEAGHGTGRLSTDLIEQHQIQVPDDSSIIGVLDGLVARGALAEQESAQLAATRDALLPELLSGRLRVPEAVA